MTQRLPSVRFERGLRLIVKAPPHIRSVPTVHEYLVIGRLDDGTPFFLEYLNGGVTHWACPSFLGSSVRKKILSLLREEVRREATLPEYIAVVDLTETSGLEEPCKVREEFFNRVWRAEYLGDRNEDYVDLKVPFEEKNAAKALGARWDATRRVWKVKRQPDMSAFARWLPEIPEGLDQGGALAPSLARETPESESLLRCGEGDFRRRCVRR